MRTPGRFIADAGGSATLMVAVAAPVLLVAAGAAIDYLRVTEQRESTQVALDGAALAAARVFIDYQSDSPAEQARRATRQVQIALQDVNGHFGATPHIVVDTTAKRVDISATVVVPTSFLSLAAIESLSHEVHAAAEAELENQPVCILALRSFDSTGIEFTGQGEMKAKDCVVWSNATGSQSVTFNGNGKVKASRVCAVGRSGSVSRFTVDPQPESGCARVDDPMLRWQVPIAGVCTHQIDGWVSRTTAVLEPGVYCGGLRVDAKNIMMRPGIYVIKDGPLILRGSSRITGKAVGIFLNGEGSRLDIDGKSKVEIHAAEQGPMAGIVIAGSPLGANESSSIAGRSDLKIGGVIYLPTHRLTYWGESDTRAQSPVTTIIADSIEIGGDAFLEVKNDRSKAKYAPVVSTGKGTVKLVR